MRRHRIVLVAACSHLLSLPALAQDDAVVPATESVAGTTQTDLSLQWWQWAFSFERVRSPVADQTGAMCSSRQTGEVWFLAGTCGTRRVERTCSVPHGKTLFFPLINYIAFRGDGTNEPCMSLAARAASLTNDPSALILDIDGKRYENLTAHRLPTACFSIVPGQKADAVADGYYIAVRPLPRGTHVLNFGGALPTLMQAVTYTLNIE